MPIESTAVLCFQSLNESYLLSILLSCDAFALTRTLWLRAAGLPSAKAVLFTGKVCMILDFSTLDGL